jgi:hypothetical protein
MLSQYSYFPGKPKEISTIISIQDPADNRLMLGGRPCAQVVRVIPDHKFNHKRKFLCSSGTRKKLTRPQSSLALNMEFFQELVPTK